MRTRTAPLARLVTACVVLLALVIAACSAPAAPAAPGAATPAAATAAPAASTVGSAPTASAAAAAPQPTAAAPSGGTFVIASLGLPNTLHPYPDSAAYSDIWSQVAGLTWGCGLIDLDANTLQYVPYMASDWQVSADGKTFTFTLKDGLKWS